MPILPITIARVAPITNTALSYDGIQQYAQEHAPILPPLIMFSIEAWVKVAGIPGTDWVNPATLMQNSADNSFWLGFFQAVTPEQMMATLHIGNNSLNKPFSYLFALGQWYYVVVTVNLTTGSASLYVNASLANTITGSLTGPALTLGPLRVGGSAANTNTFFQGEIGTIRIWEGALDQTNIKLLMYRTLSGTFQARNASGNVIATLLANWRCDEGYGGIAFDYSGPALDLILGDGVSAKKPVWSISTIFKPPDFIAIPAMVIPAKAEGEVPITLLSHAPFLIAEKDLTKGKPPHEEGRPEKQATKGEPKSKKEKQSKKKS